MGGKKTRQRYFVARELRLSIAFIALWSLLAALMLIYIAKELGGALHNFILLPFIIIMVGYGAVVVAFSIYFCNRFIGPFERLKMEMRLVLAGDIKKRLAIRRKDDIYIKSFIGELNDLLDAYEARELLIHDLARCIDSEFMSIMSGLKDENLPRETRFDNTVHSYEKIKAILRQHVESQPTST
jgi:hypothetical protein